MDISSASFPPNCPANALTPTGTTSQVSFTLVHAEPLHNYEFYINNGKIQNGASWLEKFAQTGKLWGEFWVPNKSWNQVSLVWVWSFCYCFPTILVTSKTLSCYLLSICCVSLKLFQKLRAQYGVFIRLNSLECSQIVTTITKTQFPILRLNCTSLLIHQYDKPVTAWVTAMPRSGCCLAPLTTFWKFSSSLYVILLNTNFQCCLYSVL